MIYLLWVLKVVLCHGIVTAVFDTVSVTHVQIEQELWEWSCTCKVLGVPQDVKGRWWVEWLPVPTAEHAEVASDQTGVAGIAMKLLFSSMRLLTVVQ